VTATIEGTVGTFQVGDIVRVHKNDDSLKPGSEARVTGRNRYWPEEMIDVEWISAVDYPPTGWLETRFELAPAPEPEPFDPTGYVVVDREPKVGDRVVSHYTKQFDIAVNPAAKDWYDGPGVIEEDAGDGLWYVKIQTEKGQRPVLSREEFDILEKVKPQVGDVVKHDAGTTHLPAGATGDVTHLWGDGMVHVKWHDRSKQWSDGGFWSSGLTVVKRPEPEPVELEPLFQVGDRVVSHGYYNLSNTVGLGEVTHVYTDAEEPNYRVALDSGQIAYPNETELGYPEEPAPDVEPWLPLAAWEKELLGIALYDLAADSGIFGTVEDEAGLRALGKGAVIVSAVNGAEYVRISDNHYRTTLVDHTGAFGFGYNYASTVFGAIRNGNFTFLVLHPGI
jgi:hypothetical protein